MNEVLAVSLQSMQGDMARLDQVGMNLANVLTPGYKRAVAMQAPLGASFAGHVAAASNAQTQPAASPVHLAADLRAGTLKSTGQSLDVAIDGPGYFEVLTASGLAYTRQGSFHVDARSRLVTAQGDPVMGTAGEIVVDNTRPAISTAGAISSSVTGLALGQLKVIDFEAGTSPERLGEGLFAASPGMNPLPDAQVRVRQGFVENSNATSTLEMASLVQAMRHFEGMQKVLQGYDEMLGTAIRKLGDNP